MSPVDPLLPAFDGPCLSNVIRPLLGQVNGGGALPVWLPKEVAGARQIVVLVLDGLGYRQLHDRVALAPTLMAGSDQSITSVAPSTTACALTSLATGLPPAVHGVLGYRLGVDDGVFNVLGWRLDGRDVRRDLPPSEFQPFPAFPGAHVPVPVVSRSDYGPTGFSAADLRGSILHGWHTPSGLVVEVKRLNAAGAPFVYAYYDGIDRIAHARGLGEHYDAELASADRLVGDLLSVLVPGTTLIVTADHGQVDVGASSEVLDGDIMDGVRLMSGEGRFRWLHTKSGATSDVAAAAAAQYGDIAWIRTKEQLIEDGWFGGEPVPSVADRMGDVALIPFTPTAFLDPADTGEQRLAARHGSLTESEMLVPLIGYAVGH